MNPDAPELTVVLVTADGYATLRRTVRHLREQTGRERIELLLVGPTEASFADLEPDTLSDFANWRLLAAGPIHEVERALAIGVFAARAPVVALLENHVYPEPGWAAAILRAHRGPWSAVGSIIQNANPATAVSWAEHFLTYGFHDESSRGGEVARVSRNNGTFKREALLTFGDRLPDALARDGGLLDALKQQGHRFFLESQARLPHLNPSRLMPIFVLRVLSARAAAATRSRSEGWSPLRRLLYVAACPLFPALRLRALWSRLRSHPQRRVLPRVAPLLVLTLVLDAFGQALGFALGAGKSAQRAGVYDLDRLPYLCAADRARFAE